MRQLPKYASDMCPRTTDLLIRTGLTWLQPTDTPAYVRQAARQLSDGLRALPA